MLRSDPAKPGRISKHALRLMRRVLARPRRAARWWDRRVTPALPWVDFALGCEGSHLAGDQTRAAAIGHPGPYQFTNTDARLRSEAGFDMCLFWVRIVSMPPIGANQRSTFA